ncbi:ras gtpase-activating protein [Anaeramoeba flamelloides]|uniref:Ras gtpase-activating protein n=1 Tax=Anaeramoeba flamelloides TaxID=1746091 RepID=A0ABQ8Y3F9_9EUKA|nr:ras gtpase-activating protein [Anaeramoeba flamelloides]
MNKYLYDQIKKQTKQKRKKQIQTYKITPVGLNLFVPHQKSGWLYKMGKGNSRWKKRWVVLGEGFLKYYKTESTDSGTVPLGIASLSQIIGVVDLSKIWEKPNTLSVVLGDRMHVLRSDCEKECQDWVTILKISLALNTIIRRKVRKEDQELIRLLLLSLDRLETRLGFEKTKILNSISKFGNSRLKTKKSKTYQAKMKINKGSLQQIGEWRKILIMKLWILCSKQLNTFTSTYIVTHEEKINQKKVNISLGKSLKQQNWLKLKQYDIIRVYDENDPEMMIGECRDFAGLVSSDGLSKLVVADNYQIVDYIYEDFEINFKKNSNETNITTTTTNNNDKYGFGEFYQYYKCKMMSYFTRASEKTNVYKEHKPELFLLINYHFFNLSSKPSSETNLCFKVDNIESIINSEAKVNKQYSFEIKTKQQNSLFLTSFNKTTFNKWFDTIQNLINLIKLKEPVELNRKENEINKINNLIELFEKKLQLLQTKINEINKRVETNSENLQPMTFITGSNRKKNEYIHDPLNLLLNKVLLLNFKISEMNYLKNKLLSFQARLIYPMMDDDEEIVYTIQSNEKNPNNKEELSFQKRQWFILLKQINEKYFKVENDQTIGIIPQSKLQIIKLANYNDIFITDQKNDQNQNDNEPNQFDQQNNNILGTSNNTTMIDNNNQKKKNKIKLNIQNIKNPIKNKKNQNQSKSKNKNKNDRKINENKSSLKKFQNINNKKFEINSKIINNQFSEKFNNNLKKNELNSDSILTITNINKQIALGLLEEVEIAKNNGTAYPIEKKGFLYFEEKGEKMIKCWGVIICWSLFFYESPTSLQPIVAYNLKNVISLKKIESTKHQGKYQQFLIKFKRGNNLILATLEYSELVSWFSIVKTITTFNSLLLPPKIDDNKESINAKYYNLIEWIKIQLKEKLENQIKLEKFLEKNSNDQISTRRDPKELLKLFKNTSNLLNYWKNYFLAKVCRINIENMNDNRIRALTNKKSMTNNHRSDLYNYLDFQKFQWLIVLKKPEGGILKAQLKNRRGLVKENDVDIIKPLPYNESINNIKYKLENDDILSLSKKEKNRFNYKQLLDSIFKDKIKDFNQNKSNEENHNKMKNGFIKELPLFMQGTILKESKPGNNKWEIKTLLIYHWDLMIFNQNNKCELILNLQSIKSIEKNESKEFEYSFFLEFLESSYLFLVENEMELKKWTNTFKIAVTVTFLIKPLDQQKPNDIKPKYLSLIKWLENEIANESILFANLNLSFNNNEIIESQDENANQNFKNRTKLCQDWMKYLKNWREFIINRYCRLMIKPNDDERIRVFCLESYQAENKNELSFFEDDLLLLLENNGTNWKVERKINNNGQSQIGYIPANKVQIADPKRGIDETILFTKERKSSFYSHSNSNRKNSNKEKDKIKNSFNGGNEDNMNQKIKIINRLENINLNLKPKKMTNKIAKNCLEIWDLFPENKLNFPIYLSNYIYGYSYNSKFRSKSSIKWAVLRGWLLLIYKNDQEQDLLYINDLRSIKSIKKNIIESSKGNSNKNMNKNNNGQYEIILITNDSIKKFYFKVKLNFDKWFSFLKILKNFVSVLSKNFTLSVTLKNKELKINKLLSNFRWIRNEILLEKQEISSNENLFQFYKEYNDVTSITELKQTLNKNKFKINHLKIWRKRITMKIAQISFNNINIDNNKIFALGFVYKKKIINDQSSSNQYKKGKLLNVINYDWLYLLEPIDKNNDLIKCRKIENQNQNQTGYCNVKNLLIIYPFQLSQQFFIKFDAQFFGNNNENINNINFNSNQNSNSYSGKTNNDNENENENENENFFDDDNINENNNNSGSINIDNPPIFQKNELYYLAKSKISNKWKLKFVKLKGYNLIISSSTNYNKNNNKSSKVINLYQNFKFATLSSNLVPFKSSLPNKYISNVFQIVLSDINKSIIFATSDIKNKFNWINSFKLLEKYYQFQRPVYKKDYNPQMDELLSFSLLSSIKQSYQNESNIKQKLRNKSNSTQKIRQDSLMFNELENEIKQNNELLTSLKNWKKKILSRLLSLSYNKDKDYNNENNSNIINNSNSNSNNTTDNNSSVKVQEKGYINTSIKNNRNEILIKEGSWVDIINNKNMNKKIKIKYNSKIYQIEEENIEIIQPVERKGFIIDNEENSDLDSDSDSDSDSNSETGNEKLARKKKIIFKKDKIEKIDNLLFFGKEFQFTLAFSRIINISDLEIYSRSLISIFEKKHKNKYLFEPVIKDEVERTLNETTLFRGNCMTSKMMNVYTKLSGLKFLSNILKKDIEEIIEGKQSLEIDINKIKVDNNNDNDNDNNDNNDDDNDKNKIIQENFNRLSKFVEQIIESILKSPLAFPLVLRNLCWKLSEITSTKFPNSKYIVVAGFIFLRFICPAIVVPEKYGITKLIPHPQNRRDLVLVSKIIQNIANGTTFKSENMKILNPIVNKYIPKIKLFMDTLIEPCYLCKNLQNQDLLIIGKKDNKLIVCDGKSLSSNFYTILVNNLIMGTRSFDYIEEYFDVQDEQLFLCYEKVFKLLSITNYKEKLFQHFKQNSQITQLLNELYKN